MLRSFPTHRMQIAQSKTRTKYPLSTRKVLKKTIASMIVWIVLFAIFGSGFVVLSFTLGGLFKYVAVGVVALFLLLFLAIYLYQSWYFAVYYYELEENYIVIRKGPITPSEITIPYERIQDVYVDQDLFDRFLGLYDVHLSSATISSGRSAHIDGVEKAAADGLKEALLEIVSRKIRKTTVATAS